MKKYSNSKKSIYSKKPAKLPSSYLELFFDTIKQNWRTIILIGFLSLLFFLPSLFFMFWDDLYFLQLLSTPDLEVSEIDALRITSTNFFNVFVCLGLLFASVGVSGLSRINLLISREEGVIFFPDFNKGVKQNIRTNFIFFLIYGVLLYLSLLALNTFGGFLRIVPFALVQSIVFPLLLIIIETNTIYDWSLKHSLINAVFIYIKNFFVIIIFALLFTSILLLDGIRYIVLKYILYALIILLIYPFLTLAMRVYFNKILDRDINKIHYPEIYKKGIYEAVNDEYFENVISKFYSEESTYHTLKNDPYLDHYYYHLCSFLDEDVDIKNKKLMNDDGVWPNDAIIESLNFLRGLSYKKQLTYLAKKLYSVLALRQENKSKVAIVLAGGGYNCVCTLPEDIPVSVDLFKKGFTVFSFVYPTKNDAKEASNCLNSFISFLFKNQEKMNIDMEDYIIVGFSAGAHLAASIGTNHLGVSSLGLVKPKLLVLAYPVITMKEKAEVGTKNNLLGTKPSEEDIEKYSIEEHISSDYPNVFVWQCERDNVVDFSNSLLLVESLKKAEVDYRFESFNDDVHGYGIAKGKIADGWLDRMYQYYLLITKSK